MDAHGRFVYIDVDANERTNDTTIYKDSKFHKTLHDGSLKIPPSTFLPGQDTETSFFFIGDDALPLSRNLLNPFNPHDALSLPEQVYNYRISRARTVMECAFENFVKRFKIFKKPIETKLETTDMIVKACCALHNYLTKDVLEAPQDDEICLSDNNLEGIGQQHVECNSLAAKARINVVQYLITDGIIELVE